MPEDFRGHEPIMVVWVISMDGPVFQDGACGRPFVLDLGKSADAMRAYGRELRHVGNSEVFWARDWGWLQGALCH